MKNLNTIVFKESQVTISKDDILETLKHLKLNDESDFIIPTYYKIEVIKDDESYYGISIKDEGGYTVCSTSLEPEYADRIESRDEVTLNYISSALIESFYSRLHVTARKGSILYISRKGFISDTAFDFHIQDGVLKIGPSDIPTDKEMSVHELYEVVAQGFMKRFSGAKFWDSLTNEVLLTTEALEVLIMRTVRAVLNNWALSEL